MKRFGFAAWAFIFACSGAQAAETRQDLDQHADNIWPRIPEIHPDDLKPIIEHLGETNPKAKDISPSDVIYPVPVRDVAKSGFADQVAGKQ
ncbi:MAG: hypothetical protein ACREQK_03905 [Candidatus Binatia bacterium]